MKKKINMTIIIPASDDLKIKECIESIDENVDILVSLNGPSKEMIRLIKDLQVNFCRMNKRNLGAALDKGVKNAKFDKVLFMDSDCIFGKGTIKRLYVGLDRHELSKGVVVFGRKDFFSKIIADIRDYTTSGEPNAYNPPLAMKKSIIKKIGYYFDKDIHWEEDDDLNDRVKKAKINIKMVPSARIYHPAPTLFSDFRSSFRYGTGRRIGVEKGIFSFNPLRYLEIGILWKKGPFHFIYLILWNLSYFVGYFSQMFFNVQNVKIRK